MLKLKRAKQEKPVKKPDKQLDLEYPLDFEKAMKRILQAPPPEKKRKTPNSHDSR